MPRELRPLIRACRLQPVRPSVGGRPRTWTGTYQGGAARRPLVASLVGVGPARAAAAAAEAVDRHAPTSVVVLGVAGGLDPRLHVADVVAPSTVVDASSDVTFRPHGFLGLTEPRDGAPQDGGRRAPHGRRRAGPRILLDATLVTVAAPWQPLDPALAARASALDMETAAIAGVCEAAGAPWTVVRAVSDLPGTLTPEVMTLLGPDGRVRMLVVARLLAARPTTAVILGRLGLDTSRAVRAATDVLLDALAEGIGRRGRLWGLPDPRRSRAPGRRG